MWKRGTGSIRAAVPVAWGNCVRSSKQSILSTSGLVTCGQQATTLEQVLHDPKLIAVIREMRLSGSKTGRQIVDHTVRTSQGERTFQITLSTVAEDGDAPTGVVAVLQDMTREKEVSEMKNDFASMVSHELRTPLASIKAYVEMLIDGEAEDAKTQREFYEVIQNEANRLGRLIDNILNNWQLQASGL